MHRREGALCKSNEVSQSLPELVAFFLNFKMPLLNTRKRHSIKLVETSVLQEFDEILQYSTPSQNYLPSNGTCSPSTSIDVKDLLVMVASAMIVFTAFTSMLCVLLRDQKNEDEEGNRSRYSVNSIR